MPIKKDNLFKLVRNKEATALRNRGLMLVEKNKKRKSIPLNIDGGILLGIYEIKTKYGNELITFYFNGKTISLYKRNKLGDPIKIGGFSKDLEYREVSKDYRNQGLATEAFNLIEQYKEFQQKQKNNPDLNISIFTRKRDTAAFLKKRGYEIIDGKIIGEFRKKEPDEVMYGTTLKKHIPVGKTKKFWNDISKYHKIKIVGSDGKIKYWFSKIKTPLKYKT